MPSTPDGLDRRVARVEVVLPAIQTEVEGLGRAVAGIEVKIDRLVEALGDANRTPWPQIIGGAALMLTVIGFVGSFYARDLGRVEKDVDRNSRRLVSIVDPDDYREDYRDLERRIDRVDPLIERVKSLERRVGENSP